MINNRQRRSTAPNMRVSPRVAVQTRPPMSGGRDDRPRLGSTIAVLKQAVRDRAQRMATLLKGEALQDFVTVLGELEDEELSIAVVGQVKAGKSTFINALVERPGLLPSDVNPWTSAVAKLHFGRPSGPKDGATFQFFTHDEWAHIAETGGSAATMARRLCPDGDEKALADQMLLMKERAEKRMGRQFRHLLGKVHRFGTIDRQTLERYLCSGEEPEGHEEATELAGRFADITREANLYFDQGAFGTYCTVVDTPGTNDPFLARGEITRRFLGSAHAYVLVITAQQALSTSDMALLRLIHGLHKSRLVLFVNRADKLGDPVGDKARIREHVTRILKKEWPNTDIPLVIGSAWWAEQVLRDDITWLAKAAQTPAVSQCVQEARLFTPKQWSAIETDPLGHRDELRRAILHCSGLGEVRSCLSHVLNTGRGAHVLTGAVNGLLHIAGAAGARAKREIADLQEAIGRLEDGAANRERQMATVQQRLESISSQRSEAQLRWVEQASELRVLVMESLRALEVILRATVTNHANAIAHALVEQGGRLGVGRVWRCDTTPLRQALEHQFTTGYDRMRASIMQAQRNLSASLVELVKLLDADGDDERWAQPADIDLEPSMASIGVAVTVDLGPVWQRWWGRNKNLEDKAEQVRAVIEDDFGDVATELMSSAARAVTAAVDKTLMRFERALQTYGDELEQRQIDLIDVHESLRSHVGGSALSAQVQDLEERMAAAHERTIGLRHARNDLMALPIRLDSIRRTR